MVFVPPGTQTDGASDLFVVNDLGCIGGGMHTQILDGNGALIGPPFGPPSVCGYGGGPARRSVLGSPRNPVRSTAASALHRRSRQLRLGRARSWALVLHVRVSRARLAHADAGHQPLVPGRRRARRHSHSVSRNAPAASPAIFMGMSASAAGLASGGPGCSPPICDDIDALSAFNFSLSAASPSVPGLAPGDIVGFGPAVVVPAGVLGLTIGDEADAPSDHQSLSDLCRRRPAGLRRRRSGSRL